MNEQNGDKLTHQLVSKGNPWYGPITVQYETCGEIIPFLFFMFPTFVFFSFVLLLVTYRQKVAMSPWFRTEQLVLSTSVTTHLYWWFIEQVSSLLKWSSTIIIIVALTI